MKIFIKVNVNCALHKGEKTEAMFAIRLLPPRRLSCNCLLKAGIEKYAQRNLKANDVRRAVQRFLQVQSGERKVFRCTWQCLATGDVIE